MDSAIHPTERVRNRALGCLAGVAMGDAMGMPGELWTRRHIQHHFGSITQFLPGPDGHFVVDGFRAGQYTDDTQQTLMLAEAIIANHGQVDADVVAQHLLAWADRVGASSGNFLGPSSAKTVEELRAGKAPRQLEAAGETNGAAMRIAPVGLVRGTQDLSRLVHDVHESCLFSHNTSVAIGGASFVAAVISAALDSHEENGPNLLAHCIDVGMQAAALGVSLGVEVVSASLIARIRLALRLASQAGSDEEFSQRLYDEVGCSVATIDSVASAAGLLARGQGDPLRVALLAANLGGDTDSIGAIATGMAGAMAGLDGIPGALLTTLLEVNGPQLLEVDLLQYRN